MSEILYWLRRMWLKRQIAVCAYRLEELERLVAREKAAIEWHQHVLNERLLALQTRRINARLGEVKA